MYNMQATVEVLAIVGERFLADVEKTGYGPRLVDVWLFHDEDEPDESIWLTLWDMLTQFEDVIKREKGG
jgi:hypothetical protein